MLVGILDILTSAFSAALIDVGKHCRIMMQAWQQDILNYCPPTDHCLCLYMI